MLLCIKPKTGAHSAPATCPLYFSLTSPGKVYFRSFAWIVFFVRDTLLSVYGSSFILFSFLFQFHLFKKAFLCPSMLFISYPVLQLYFMLLISNITVYIYLFIAPHLALAGLECGIHLGDDLIRSVQYLLL